MAFRLISKSAANAAIVARPTLINASRQSLGATAVRHYTTQKEGTTLFDEKKTKQNRDKHGRLTKYILY
ncbi:hypothetical protein G6F42_015657 [Rhizopus arrhizus]|nr:hypothetical protein G6F42_015657 [Rhizopus arrhizus]